MKKQINIITTLLLFIVGFAQNIKAQNFIVRPIQTNSITMSTAPLSGQISYFANGLGAGTTFCTYSGTASPEASSLILSPSTIFNFNLAQAPSASNDFNKINAFMIFIDPITTTPGSPKTLTIKLYNGSTLLNSGNTNFTTFDPDPIYAMFQTIKLNNEYTNVTRAEVTILTGYTSGTIRQNEFALTYDYNDTPIISSVSPANQIILPNTIPNPITITATKPTPIIPIEPASPHVTYQWYSNTKNTTTGGTLITGATSSTYTPKASANEGTMYYYARVYGDKNTCKHPYTTSTIVSVTVDSAACIGPDSDGDGIPDICDLDDDNDGILDTDECLASTGSLISYFNSGNTTATSYISTNIVGANSLAGKGLTAAIVGGSQNYMRLNTIDATNEAAAIANNEYIEYSITPNKYIALQEVGYYSPFEAANTYNFSLRVSTDNFSTNTLIHGNYKYEPNKGDLNILVDGGIFYMEPSKTYRFRVYFYNVKGGSSAEIIHDDFKLNGFIECDTDGDGIPDRLDLDSDNDGCLDAIEGGANFDTADLVTAWGKLSVGAGSLALNQNLCANGTCIDANGVPTIAGITGQSIGDSKNATLNSQCEQICTEEVAGETFNWFYKSEDITSNIVTSKVPAQPGTDYGYAFDIYQLDNSFNMTINGVQLATKELNFQE